MPTTSSHRRSLDTGASPARTPPSSGTNSASTPRAPPTTRSSASPSRSSTSEATISRSGASGQIASPRSTHRPTQTRNPRPSARVASSCTRRDLPTPASPAISATADPSSAATSKARSSRAISPWRPTNARARRPQPHVVILAPPIDHEVTTTGRLQHGSLARACLQASTAATSSRRSADGTATTGDAGTGVVDPTSSDVMAITPSTAAPPASSRLSVGNQGRR